MREIHIYEELKELETYSQEHFVAVYLDSSNNIIETRVITIGTVNQSLVHPREVFSPAIEKRVTSLIVAHNHPSGILEPSNEDIKVTERLKEAGKNLGIELLDHIIISKNGFVSLREDGLI